MLGSLIVWYGALRLFDMAAALCGSYGNCDSEGVIYDFGGLITLEETNLHSVQLPNIYNRPYQVQGDGLG